MCVLETIHHIFIIYIIIIVILSYAIPLPSILTLLVDATLPQAGSDHVGHVGGLGGSQLLVDIHPPMGPWIKLPTCPPISSSWR